MSVISVAKKEDVESEYTERIYPDSDGETMGESGFHVTAIIYLCNALRFLFFRDPNVYVAADMFLYYKEGHPEAKKAPDVMVIRGAGNHDRRVFKIWEEKVVPCVIFEITSGSTKNEDMIHKKKLYASLKIQEYFLFDPLREYLDGVMGFHLTPKGYASLDTDHQGRVFSKSLNLFFKPENAILQVIDPKTNRPVPRIEDAFQMVESERKRVETERQRSEKLAEKLRKLGIDPDNL